jgi:hypothetical protein
MAADVLGDEGTDGRHREAAFPGVLEDRGCQSAAQTTSFVFWLGFRVEKGDAARVQAIRGEACQRLAQMELVTVQLAVVGDADLVRW